MTDFLSDAWRPILAHNQLTDFEALWQVEAGWFEEPNQRRGGWSGVSRLELRHPEGGTRAIFIKRQENHKIFSWRHPLTGVPTFLKEFGNIMHYRRHHVATLEPIYFAMRRTASGHRAILVTAELTGFAPLTAYAPTAAAGIALSREARRHLVESVARLARRMHASHIQHNCFYPKHVFAHIAADKGVETCVIDLEKSRWRPFSLLATLRDLDTLNRHAPDWRRTERLHFLKTYLGEEKSGAHTRWLWRRLAAARARKSGSASRNPS
jgi:hypothetical protein